MSLPDETAGARLERAPDLRRARRHEVLNFDPRTTVSGSTYRLARGGTRHAPDRRGPRLRRSCSTARCVPRAGCLPVTAGETAVWLSTFRLEGGRLMEPAGDFARFVRIQADVRRSEFGGARSRRRSCGWLPGGGSAARTVGATTPSSRSQHCLTGTTPAPAGSAGCRGGGRCQPGRDRRPLARR